MRSTKPVLFAALLALSCGSSHAAGGSVVVASVRTVGDGIDVVLESAVAATRTPLRLHEPNYNMLAYVYSTKYQNSNGWVLETLAAAAAPPGQVETRAEAQTWLRSIGFQPPTVEVPAAVRLGARMFRANVAFDDHPIERRMAGQIDTVSTDAVLRMVRMVDPQARTLVID